LISSFDPDAETQARWIAAAAEVARAHLAALAVGGPHPNRTVADRPSISEEPLHGGIEAALDYVSSATDGSLATTSPGFMAYIPGGGIFATAVADFVADVLNRYTGLAATAPEFVRIEHEVIAWLAREFGYGPSATGVLTSGGSVATLLGVTRARDDTDASGDLRRLTGYTSAQAHGSVASAFRLAGLPAGNLRLVACDAEFKMSAAALEEAVQTDRAAGLRPFMVVASAGTTNTGAIDPLEAIADLCGRERLWMHVDAAYGGAFVLCPDGRRRLAGIERAHSISFDPHKGLFLPYGTGCVLFRDPLVPLNGGDAYLRDARSGEDAWNPADFGLELTRPFRGLRVWLPLVLHGAGAFRAAIAQKLELAARLHQGLLDLPAGRIEIVAAPQLTVVAVARPRLAGEPLADWNGRNEQMLRAINGRGRSVLSSTLLPGNDGDRLVVRACILSHRTSEPQIEALLEDLRAATEA
jgi:aromatic-L-amino-acid decarboxylase